MTIIFFFRTDDFQIIGHAADDYNDESCLPQGLETLQFIDNVDDDDYLSEDADDDDGVAATDDELVEKEPVAIVMIVPPSLRRSKRVAAQQCKALRSAVAPSPYAITGLRRSARLAAKPRVNYKY
jgi:hypothetical protein